MHAQTPQKFGGWRAAATLAGLALLALSLPAFFVTGQRIDTDFPVRALFPIAHVVWFALLALALGQVPALRARGRTVRVGIILLAALALGAAIEWLQGYAGRDASVEDIGANLLGAGLGIALMLRGATRLALLSATTATVAWAFFAPLTIIADHLLAPLRLPVISDFENAIEHRRWAGGTESSERAFDGQYSLAGTFEGRGYSRFSLRRQVSDWTGYDTLHLALHASSAIDVTVSIGDAQHTQTGFLRDDRFDARFHLLPGWNELSIPLAAVEAAPATRRADLSRVRRFVVFTRNPPAPVRMHLDAVRLSKRR